MRRYLYLTVFVSGMTTLAAELSAARLIGNVFGTSNLVWASIIGLILIYLTVGYFLGGRWADRLPRAEGLYRALAWGSFTLGVVPYAAQPVLRAAATAFEGLQAGVLAGSFGAVLVLFVIPITLLGTVSPYAIRLSLDDAGRAGNVAGNIYAISTLGSFIGTFLPVLVLIPTIGTRLTFLVFSLSLLTVALAGLGMYAGRRALLAHAWMPVALVLLAILASGQRLKDTKGQIFEAESAYNYILVQEIGGYRLLRLNDGQGVHSIYHPKELYYAGPWEQFLVGPFFNEGQTPEGVERIAIVGLAAGTTARQATAVFGPIPIDGWEIDPEIIAVGREYFGMTMPNLNVYVEDGRWGLEQSPHQYDIIAVDAYRPPYIPPHMTTREFFAIAASHLTPAGVLTINVGRAPGDRRLIDGLATTLATVFPSVYVMDIPNTFNSMIYATKRPTTVEAFTDNLAVLSRRGDIHPLLLTAMSATIVNLQPGYQQAEVFSDDRAPIEWITNIMIINFILRGDVGTLQ